MTAGAKFCLYRLLWLHRRLQGEGAPRSAAEFERAALAAPSSSYTWIR